MIEVPRNLPLIERAAVRLIVLDASDRVLLFQTRDRTYPELGTWWELPLVGSCERPNDEITEISHAWVPPCVRSTCWLAS